MPDKHGRLSALCKATHSGYEVWTYQICIHACVGHLVDTIHAQHMLDMHCTWIWHVQLMINTKCPHLTRG